MSASKMDGVADDGSLAPEVLADLVALRNFMMARQTAMESLYGRRLPPSLLRDELIRAVVIEFGFGRSRPIEHFARVCAAAGNAADVDTEMRLLEELGLLLITGDGKPGDGKAGGGRVRPTKKLIDWYSSIMPRLMEEVRMVMAARAASHDG